MEVGSLVELVNDNWKNLKFDYPNLKFPVVNVIYTVRAIIDYGFTIGILLEEIDNTGSVRFKFSGEEPNFNIERFVEIQPPMNVSELVEESIYELV